jgi:hypothetical protein
MDCFLILEFVIAKVPQYNEKHYLLIIIICNNLPKKPYNKKARITMFNLKQKFKKKKWSIVAKEF